MRAIRSSFFGVVALLVGLVPALADNEYKSCGTLFEGNPPVICFQVLRSSQKTTLSDTYYHTEVVNNCSSTVSVQVDYGDKVTTARIYAGRTSTLSCEDTPTCHSGKPYPVTSHCCNRPPSVQSCAFIGKRTNQEAKKTVPREGNANAKAPAAAVAQKKNMETGALPKAAANPESEVKLTSKEKRALESCFGDRQCIEIVIKDAAARATKDDKDAEEKAVRDEKAFIEFVKKETARRQAKADEESRMREYHEEQNAGVAKQFFNGATQLLQGYVNSQSANGGSASGTTTGSAYKPLTTGSGSGAPQCGKGPNGGCR